MLCVRHHRQFGDWCAIESRSVCTPNTGPPAAAANYLLALEAMAAMAGALGKTSPDDFADLAVAAVVKSVRQIVDRLPGEMLEDMYAPICHHLGLKTEHLSGKFKSRVCGTLHTQLVEFMDTVFAKELSQLLEATASSSGGDKNMALRHQLMSIVREGDQVTLFGIKSKLEQNAAEKRNPPQQAPSASLLPQAGFPNPQSSSAFVPPPTPRTGSAAPSNSSASSGSFASASSGAAALAKAALEGDLATVLQCIQNRVDLNAAPSNGWTALMNATLQGHSSVVDALLAAGANPNLKDQGGFSALMYACSYGHVTIAETLARSGANVSDVDNTGRTIKSYAANPTMLAAINRGLAARGSPLLS